MRNLFVTFVLMFFGLWAQSSPSANDTTAQELRILSYNIKMLPRILAHLHHKPLQRAKLIPEVIAADSAQVIVFQKRSTAKP